MDIQKTQNKPLPGAFDSEGLSYLDQRWLDAPEAKRMRISAIGGMVWFPYAIDGEIVRWKARSITDKKKQFWTALPEGQKEDWKAPFFNQKEPYDTKYLIITEGEFDCMALCQLGATNCVSLPNGSASVEATFRNNYQFLQKFDRVYIAFDMDEPGNLAASKAMKMLPANKYRRIMFPQGEVECKDANDWLINTAAKPDDLANLLFTAVRPRCDRIQHMSDADQSLFDEIDFGVPTQWPSLNRILGGIRKKEVTVISAETGCGKTTFCLNLAAHLAEKKKAVWINSFEMDSKIIYRKLTSVILSKNIRVRKFEDVERQGFYTWALTHDVYVNPKNTGSSIQEIRKDFEIACLAFNVEFVILDHLDYIHSLGDKKTSLENIDETVRELHSLAMEFDVGIILVAHPRQIQGPVRPLSINDLKGSSAIKQYADNILLLTRMDTLDPTQTNQVKLTVVKNRLLGNQASVNLKYNPSTDCYSEEQICYYSQDTQTTKGLPYADN